jgi:hypothetical protein
MCYELEYSPEAFERLPASLPTQVVESLRDALDALAQSPTSLSRPTVLPYAPRGQLFHHHCDHQGTRHRFAVFFFFSQDETRLRIFAILYDSQPWQPKGEKPR